MSVHRAGMLLQWRARMQTLLRRALFAFLAAWMPFCCCQVRAAARAIAHAPHVEASERCCCDEPAAEEADAGCCGHERPTGEPECCTTCKDRVGPVAPAIEVPDLSPQLDAVSTALLADAERACATGTVPGEASLLDTGPPWRPHGRAALALHATLLI